MQLWQQHCRSSSYGKCSMKLKMCNSSTTTMLFSVVHIVSWQRKDEAFLEEKYNTTDRKTGFVASLKRKQLVIRIPSWLFLHNT
jgi:hypothetical protein